MAWKAKPSGSMEIPRRDEPWLTPAIEQEIRDTIMPRYAKPMGAIMHSLHAIQHEHGYIAYQAMIELATVLGLNPTDILDTASFYEEYHLEPVGRCVIGICQSVACEMCGHQALVDHVRNELQIDPHETTNDGIFTLLTLECLGSCDTAPCALVNDERFDNLTLEQLDRLIEQERAR